MLLKKGSRGEEVKQLQTLLGLSADGSFGPMTETKVKEWQAKMD
jgi:peptidoglycan hydrolase-like protein with peptidoglycan-binding domain